MMQHKQHAVALTEQIRQIARRIEEAQLDLQREASMEGGE